MMRALDNKSLAQDKTKREMWLGILAIARNLMEHESPDDVYFYDLGVLKAVN